MKALNDKIADSLTRHQERQALLHAVERGRTARAATLAEWPDGASFRPYVKAVKEKCIAVLPELIDQFTQNASQRGASVYHAASGADACNYILALAQEKGAKLITKSKSLTTEEIELNHPLQAAGLEVVETDLGELIIQMAGELPYHLVFPAVHKTAQDVAALFREKTGEAVSGDLEEIMSLMRRTLRPTFLNADIGITGANVAIAETGSFLIETNEGNGRLVSAIPPVHVCVVGIEKIVGTIEDAMKMIFAHPVSAVGQLLTTYVSIFAGRSPLAGQANRELHIVLLDNGRLRMRQDAWFSEALHCIRCGACMNICPTYGVVGGHIFGHIYPGPIGIPWTAAVHGRKHAADFQDLCISCGLCREICPADIDLPMMIAKVKYESLPFTGQPVANRILMANESVAKAASVTPELANRLLQFPLVRTLLEKALGIDRRRTLPSFARRTLRKKFRPGREAGDPRHSVVFFTDYFFNYVAPELGMAAVNFLKQAGLKIMMPKQKTSGYPYISYGELKKARRIASYNIRNLWPLVNEGMTVITLEPTAAYALKFCYPKLLQDSPEAAHVAANTYEFFEWLQIQVQQGSIKLPHLNDKVRYGFHIACHERACSSGMATLSILRQIGLEVEVIETGTCCGMAGTFGMKRGPLGFDLSMQVGQPLFELFEARNVEKIITESSVCTMQLQDGTGLPVVHPLSLLAANSALQ